MCNLFCQVNTRRVAAIGAMIWDLLQTQLKSQPFNHGVQLQPARRTCRPGVLEHQHLAATEGGLR